MSQEGKRTLTQQERVSFYFYFYIIFSRILQKKKNTLISFLLQPLLELHLL